MFRKLALCGSALLALHAEAALANTLTTNYSLNKPSIGADANNWGNLDNANFDTIDATMFAISGVANAACPKAGCTYTGASVLPDGWAINGAAGTNRRLFFQTGGSNVWALYADSSAQSGSNAGSLLEIGRYSDAGAYLDSPVTINRATGMVTFADGLTGTLTGNASTASKLATGHTIGFSSGDVTGTTSAFDGSANLTGQVLTLATVNSAPGACGDGTHVCQVTTNGKGLVTAQSATAIATATGAQVVAGTDNAHFVTPASLASQQAQSASCGANCTGGYVTLPGGVVMQWGHYDTGANAWNGGATITFPLTFPNGCLSFVGMTDNQGGAGSPRYALQATSACSTGGITVSAAGYQSAGANNIHGFYFVAYGN